MNKYDLEYIDKLRIHELRDFARKLGVSSPTTMKKDELITRISTIIGDENFSADKDNRFIKKDNEIDFFSLLTSDNTNIITNLLSTPKDKPKKIRADENTNPIILKKNKSLNIDAPYSAYEDVVQYSFRLKQDIVNSDDESVYSVSGYLDIHPSGYGILRNNGFIPSENDSYLTSALLKRHNLQKGYFIQGKAKFIMENKPKVVYEIVDIDNKNTKNVSYDDMEYNGIGSAYDLRKFSIDMKKGERHYIAHMSIADAVELATDLVEENSTRVKFVNIKARPEENYKSFDKLEMINIPFHKSEIEIVNTVELVAERIKREMEYGKQNILILYNFCDLIRVFNIACEGCVDFDKINSKAVNKIYKIMYLSKFVDENLNCSVICIDKNGIPRDLKSLMELELIPLFNICHDNVSKK